MSVRQSIRYHLLSILGATVFLGFTSTLGHSSSPPGLAVGPSQAAASTAVDPTRAAGWLADLKEKVKDAKENLKEAEATVGTDPGPLQEPMLSMVAANLDGVEAQIQDILDPGTYPSLTPADAGEVDPRINPDTLPEYAVHALAQAAIALVECDEAVPDHEVLGSALKTIEALLPGYRDEAGVE